jgi:hypothetical protein
MVYIVCRPLFVAPPYSNLLFFFGGTASPGDQENLLGQVDTVFNIRIEKVRAAKAYFGQLPCSHAALTHEL